MVTIISSKIIIDLFMSYETNEISPLPIAIIFLKTVKARKAIG